MSHDRQSASMLWFRDPDGNELLLVQPHLT
jgi:hypothetical protein